LLITWAVVHAIQTRTLEDFSRYSLYIASPIALGALIVGSLEWKKAGFPASGLLFVPFGAVALIFLGAFYYSIAASLRDLYFWVQAPELSRTGAVAVAICATLILGAGLFYFRLRMRSIYGITEATVGLAVAAHRVATESGSAAQDPAFYLALLTAGVYLVVRGLDNVHQGLTKDPRDMAALKVLESLRRLAGGSRDGEAGDKSAA